MKANDYRLMERCIEDGLAYGWARAHKHNSNPTDAAILEEQRRYIMAEIAEWFVFEDVTNP